MKTLYVGNIPWTTTEEELKDLFTSTAEVHECRIITERASRRSKGYGFVEVNEDEAEKLIEQFDGYELEGRKLVVNEARPREQ